MNYTGAISSLQLPYKVPSLEGIEVHDLVCKPWLDESMCLMIDTEGDIWCSGGNSASAVACPGGSFINPSRSGFRKSNGKKLYL